MPTETVPTEIPDDLFFVDMEQEAWKVAYNNACASGLPGEQAKQFADIHAIAADRSNN